MNDQKSERLWLIVLAFAAVYFIWGSTYFFIEMVVKYLPPMVTGALRFVLAGAIMLGWLAYKGEKIWKRNNIFPAMVSGVLMLFIGNGSVMWTEQHLPSSFVAIFMASAPLWFLVLDKINWKQNFSSHYTLMGVLVGLIGVIALFYEKLAASSYTKSILPLLVLTMANISWVLGSLYSKYKSNPASPFITSGWQMLAGGFAFAIAGAINGDFFRVQWQDIPAKVWVATAYLLIFGSVIAYSAYIFLLTVRTPAQVSSYAYVNPLVAVVLGVFINHDKLTSLQLSGLAIILCSVFLINLAKRKKMITKAPAEASGT